MSIADKNYMCAAFVRGMTITLVMWMIMTIEGRNNTTRVGAYNIIFSPSPLMCLLSFGVPHNLISLDLDSFNVMNISVAFPLSCG